MSAIANFCPFPVEKCFALETGGKSVYPAVFMRLRLQLATVEHAPEISALRAAVAARLAERHGPGPWARTSTVKGVLYDLRHAVVYIAVRRGRIIATLALGTKKPWAIDRRFFTRCRRPLYLTSMAVATELQGQGIGRLCLDETQKLATAWPAETLCLDAYDAPAGAGEFYKCCGYTEVGRASYRGVPLIYFELKLTATAAADTATHRRRRR
ncbi:MAG TPA: GNAT family N-acetyltransferase [Verrucomicrobiae bacterium]|nr:GNAT family N-acetyltransferase [Verrucomicrobiae bacterium]